MGNIPARHRRTDPGLRHQEKARSVMRRACGGSPFSLIEIDTLQAFADVKSSDGNAEYVEFLSQVRPMTRVPGRPTIMVSAHPVKGADENSLIRGAGAILNLRRRAATSNCAGKASTASARPCSRQLRWSANCRIESSCSIASQTSATPSASHSRRSGGGRSRAAGK
jgi:hypothetical protein